MVRGNILSLFFFSPRLFTHLRFWEPEISLKKPCFGKHVWKVTFWRKNKRIVRKQNNLNIFSPTSFFCFFLFFPNSVSAMEHESWLQQVGSLNLLLIRSEFCWHCFFCTPGTCDKSFGSDVSSLKKILSFCKTQFGTCYQKNFQFASEHPH